MSLTLYILIWLLPSILISMVLGGTIGYGIALRRHGDQIEKERVKTLTALQGVLKATEELSTEVGTHQQELETVSRDLDHVAADGRYEQIKTQLLEQIERAVRSNKLLEQDLICTRFQLQVQAQELDRTRQEARHDALSGVANRKAFDETLRYLITMFHRRGKPFALLLIDVDHFKWINDTHGHLCGDQVVSRIGTVLQSVIRPTDQVARYGGDEFTVLLRDVDAEGALEVSQRIRQRMESTTFDVGPDGARIAVTLSMGLTVAGANESEVSLLRKADEALYVSKRAGRNRLTVWSPSCQQDESLPSERAIYAQLPPPTATTGDQPVT